MEQVYQFAILKKLDWTVQMTSKIWVFTGGAYVNLEFYYSVTSFGFSIHFMFKGASILFYVPASLLYTLY